VTHIAPRETAIPRGLWRKQGIAATRCGDKPWLVPMPDTWGAPMVSVPNDINRRIL